MYNDMISMEQMFMKGVKAERDNFLSMIPEPQEHIKKRDKKSITKNSLSKKVTSSSDFLDKIKS